MATTACLAVVLRAADKSLAYARIAPGFGNAILGYVPDGMGNYSVLESRRDSTGRVWLRLGFVSGTTGWVSSDRLSIQGDCSDEGYGVVSKPTQASTLPYIPPGTPTPTPVPTPPPSKDTPDRIRKAAFNITTGFEGATYDTYQNYDDGIVSFGRFGFTLASGSLSSVIDAYLTLASGPVAVQLRNFYQQRIRNGDPSLRYDTTLRNLLVAAGADPLMHTMQDQVATTQYWNVIQNLSIKPRNLVLPLSQAFLFDTGVNNGIYHDMITSAEDQLHVPERSRILDNGITEWQLISTVAGIRRDRLYAVANSENLPGLKPRADFWVNIMKAGDWNLQGDSSGRVLIKSGVQIQVRNP